MSSGPLRRIVIASFCKLGDTLSLLPTLWALRDAYPDAHICLASEYCPGTSFVTAADLLKGTCLVDSFAPIAVTDHFWRKALNRIFLVMSKSVKRWDLGVVLMSPYPPTPQSVLDTLRKHLRRFRAKRIIGPPHPLPFQVGLDGFLARAPHISDSLLDILRPLGLSLPSAQEGRFELPPFGNEAREADLFLHENGLLSDDMPLMAVAISSNMPSKVWPRERFVEVLSALRAESNIFPLFFGAGKESAETNAAIADLGNYGMAIIDKPLRWVAELLRRCDFYFGNDTGLMHLAAATGLRCVALFSSRTAPGEWFPYGHGHEVLRTRIRCENCQLAECIEMKNACLKEISTKDALDACKRLLTALSIARRGS